LHDRWRYLRRRLPRVRDTGERVLDVGCGSGAFTIGAASRGYEAVGLSWDERNQAVAQHRADLSKVRSVSFAIGDARELDKQEEFVGAFDIVICFETIEHVLNDGKLLRDLARCMKPGGRLYLTAPNYYYQPLAPEEMGPFQATEQGWHVRRGYSPAMLRELCAVAKLEVEEITYVTYFFSQLVIRMQLAITCVIGVLAAWMATALFRILPPVLDGWLGRWLSHVVGWPGYSIALAAYKPRFAESSTAEDSRSPRR
jgi:2-polyprenyl-3-methyl-5-hydroxy-6-metoxy-1,4-benzoquinol methylase